MNNVVLIGRLTKDVELQMTQSNKIFTKFTLAVNRKTDETDFINCVAWNKTAELMNQFLRKGSLIGIEGHIQTRSYENQQGQRVYITEVLVNSLEFLEKKDRT